MERYTSANVENVLELKKSRLREWVITQGYIRRLKVSAGQGRPMQFSRADVYAIAVFKHLIDDLGIARDKAGEMVSSWYHPEEDAAEVKKIAFIREGKKFIPVHWWQDEQIQVLNEQKNWDEVVIVNFQKIKPATDIAFKHLR